MFITYDITPLTNQLRAGNDDPASIDTPTEALC